MSIPNMIGILYICNSFYEFFSLLNKFYLAGSCGFLGIGCCAAPRFKDGF